MMRWAVSVVLLLMLAAPAWAGFDEGLTAAKRGDYATALREFRPLAEQGDAVAQYILGVMYAKGRGVTQDYAEAVRWYRKAAERGYAKAQYNLGFIYSKGRGGPQDYGTAVRWLRKAAEQGDSEAQNNLAYIFATASDGRYRNGPEAIRYAKQAVAHADTAAVRDTLAAAYAAAGQFDNAVREQKKAIQMQRSSGKSTTGLEKRLRLYQSRQALTCPGGPC